MGDSRARWSATEEIRYLRRLFRDRPSICLKYCAVILSRSRTWDGTVDAERVEKEAERLTKLRSATHAG